MRNLLSLFLFITLLSCGNDNHQYEYYQDGSIKAEFNVVQGEYHGIYKEYHRNGNVYVETKYDHGKVVDAMYTYYEDGSIRAYSTYSKGNLKQTILYYQNGRTHQVKLYDANNREVGLFNYDSLGETMVTLVRPFFNDYKDTISLNDEYVSKISFGLPLTGKLDAYMVMEKGDSMVKINEIEKIGSYEFIVRMNPTAIGDSTYKVLFEHSPDPEDSLIVDGLIAKHSFTVK